MLLPTRCAGCAAAGPVVCPSCRDRLEAVGGCAAPDGVDRVVALWRHAGTGRALVRALKFANDRRVARHVGRWMAVSLIAELATDESAQLGPAWVLTWAPTTNARRRARGFDQAERLARAVGREIGLRPQRLLRRRPGPSQTGRTRAERLAGPRFDVCGRAPSQVVVVDDVVTTGATAAAAAAALRIGGARQVVLLVATSAPLKTERVVAEAPRRCR